MAPSLVRPFALGPPQLAISILGYVHFTSPIVLLALFLLLSMAYSIATASKEVVAHASTQQTGSRGKDLSHNALCLSRARKMDISLSRKSIFTWLSMGTISTFVGNSIVVMLHVLLNQKDHWWCGTAAAVYLVASIFTHTILLIFGLYNKPSWAHASTWALAFILESMLLVASLAIYPYEHREPVSSDRDSGQTRKGLTGWAAIEIVLHVLRIIFLLALVFSYAVFVTLPAIRHYLAEKRTNESPCETTHLFNSDVQNVTGDGPGYGSALEVDAARQRKDKIVPSLSFCWLYLRGYSLFLPYIWPAKSLRLQITAVFCLILVLMGRAVNVLLPYQVGVIVNIFSRESGGNLEVPWGEICLFALYCLLQGLLGSIRSMLWIPIRQYSYQELSTASFEHVHGLSLDFHLEKKIGEVTAALNKAKSINKLLEQITFQALPTLLDLGIAIGYFFVMFDAYYALAVATTTFTHLYITIYLAHWRRGLRREMLDSSRQVEANKNDSLVAYAYVQYFNATSRECRRHGKFVERYQSAKRRVLISSYIIEVSQNVVFTFGLLVTCFIAAYQIKVGQIKVGQFSGLVTYFAQLRGPLDSFRKLYTSIESAIINAERMLELFRKCPTVVDKPSAQDLDTFGGQISFENVKFAYNSRNLVLNGLNFTCAPGTTTALVGESGGGKSTIFHLLYRFYDVHGGKIKIDGRDVEGITIESLRRHIGIVPQETALFNQSLMDNLQYANPDATVADIHAACSAAGIHEEIMGFPLKYETSVGEMGSMLSRGQRQRVAIARAILKNPRLILLDEATAALDSPTQERIITALRNLAQGRTTLVIAHRLSTITSAHQILVLHAGKITERGTHEQLLGANGRYADMWREQEFATGSERRTAAES